MKYSNCFGKKSSRILLGTAYFGDGISENDAFEIMDSYTAFGGTHIDTARLYANGAAEEIVGKWLKSRKPECILVSTKGAYYDYDAGEAPRLTKKDIEHDLDKSLKALGLDVIDNYWLHMDDENTPVSDIIDIMNSFVQAGKIKRFGASNWSWQRIHQANSYATKNSLIPFAASQLRFNPAYCLGERGGLVGMDNDAFNFYKENNMPVAAYSSQAKGFFSKMDKYGVDALSEKAKKRYYCDENLRRLKILKSLSEKYNCSIASVITAAFSSFMVPEVFPVIGTGKLSQLHDTMNGHNITISQTELAEIFGYNI